MTGFTASHAQVCIAAAAIGGPYRGRAALTSLVTGLAVACGGADVGGRDAEPRVWRLAEAPLLEIGVVEGDEAYQLHDVVGSVTLPDGGIAVLNAGSHEIRFYDDSGQFVRAAGREGAGPGEFRNPARLYLLHDTLAVYDDRAARLSLHALDGTFIGVRPVTFHGARFELDEWLHDRSWIDGPPLGVGRAPVIDALQRLPPPDSGELFRYVRVSPFGHLWVRQPARPGAAQYDWRVFDLDGAPIGRVALPSTFHIHEFGADYLLGRALGAYDVEYVQLHRLDTGAPPPARFVFEASTADTMRTAASDSLSADERAALTGALRMLAGPQEVHYSQSGRGYASSIEELAGYEAPPGVAVRIVSGNDRGWAAIALDEASGRMCGMANGMRVPVGWRSGRAACQ